MAAQEVVVLTHGAYRTQRRWATASPLLWLISAFSAHKAQARVRDR